MVNLLTNCTIGTNEETPFSGFTYSTTTISDDYESIALQIVRMNEFSPCEVWFSKSSEVCQFIVDFCYVNPTGFEQATFSVRFCIRIEDKALIEHLHENYLKFFTHIIECEDCYPTNVFLKPKILGNGSLLVGKVNPKTIQLIDYPYYDCKMFHLNSSIYE